MRYLLLLYADEATLQDGDDGGLEAHIAMARDAVQRGQYVTCNALKPVATATTVRVRDGRLLLSDGPFAETKEALGGYYVVDCADLDEALALAQRVPFAANGCVEVRPVQEIPGWDEAIGWSGASVR